VSPACEGRSPTRFGTDSAAAETGRRVVRRLPVVSKSGAAAAAQAGITDWLPYSAYGKNYLHAIIRLDALGRYFDTGYPYFMARQSLVPEWLWPADTAFLQHALPDCFIPQGADPMSQAKYFKATANLTGICREGRSHVYGCLA
jgi:hypothetical protein